MKVDRQEIEELDKLQDSDLLNNIGQLISTETELGIFGKQQIDQIIASGKAWLIVNKLKLSEIICQADFITTYLSSNRQHNRIVIIGAIADILNPISFLKGMPVISISILIYREGLETLCVSDDEGVE